MEGGFSKAECKGGRKCEPAEPKRKVDKIETRRKFIQTIIGNRAKVRDNLKHVKYIGIGERGILKRKKDDQSMFNPQEKAEDLALAGCPTL